MNIEENTTKLAGGKHHKKRFIDAIEPKKGEKEKPQDPRSGQEIARDIIGGLTNGFI